MRLDRFTTLAQEALNNAQSWAADHSHSELTPLHLLHALLEDPDRRYRTQPPTNRQRGGGVRRPVAASQSDRDAGAGHG